MLGVIYKKLQWKIFQRFKTVNPFPQLTFNSIMGPVAFQNSTILPTIDIHSFSFSSRQLSQVKNEVVIKLLRKKMIWDFAVIGRFVVKKRWFANDSDTKVRLSAEEVAENSGHQCEFNSLIAFIIIVCYHDFPMVLDFWITLYMLSHNTTIMEIGTNW